MLFLHEAKEKEFKRNGIPLYETLKASVEEELNGDYRLKMAYPKSDSGLYTHLSVDKIITAPTLDGVQPFRIWDLEYTDEGVEITAEHITFDMFTRKVKPLSISNHTCSTVCDMLSQYLVDGLIPYTITSDILISGSIVTKKEETLYKVLLDGDESIVGIWNGEIKRTNLNVEILQRRGKDTNLVLTPKHNILNYTGKNDLRSIVTSIHVKSTFKVEQNNEEESPRERTLEVIVHSPLINEYGYVHEAFYENNDLKTEEELVQWAKQKFEQDKIDKIPRELTFDADLLDNQTLSLGDTVLVKILDFNEDTKRKVTKTIFDALDKKLTHVTFSSEKTTGITGFGSQIGDSISKKVQSIIDVDKALQNANLAFDDKFKQEIEKIKLKIEESVASSEVIKQQISDEIELKLQPLSETTDEKIEAFFNEDERFIKLKEKINENYLEIEGLLDRVGETEGAPKYNKNRMLGETEHVFQIDDEAFAISHNGNGFEAGATYTVSWTANCIPRKKSRVTFRLLNGLTLTNTEWLSLLGARLVSSKQTNKIPPIQVVLTNEECIEDIYFDTYTIDVTGDFYQSKQETLTINQDERIVDIQLSFKEVADGNQQMRYQGKWQNQDYLIFDGGDG